MAPPSLVKMLDTIGTRQAGAVYFVVPQELLKDMIEQLGQEEASVLEPGQNTTTGLGKDQDSKEQPGREDEETDISKARAPLQDLLEEMSRMKKDVRVIQQRLGLEGSGGQSAPAEPTQVDTDTQSSKSSALGPKGHGTQPGMETSIETPGSDSLGMQAGTQGEPVTPVRLLGAPSDYTGSHHASATTPGMQPGSPGSQATIPGDAQETALPSGSSASTSTSGHEAQVREALFQLGQPGHLYAAPKEQVEQLKAAKAECEELENLRQLFPEGGQESISSIQANLQCQVSFLQDMARDLQREEEKLDEPRATAQSGGQELAECSPYNLESVVRLVKLHQRSKKLEEQEESQLQYVALRWVQDSIAQLQEDYKKLSAALGNLANDRQQEQKDIKALFQAVGRLKKQKADKEDLLQLGIDEKADIAALADKVSLSRFEANMERLHEKTEEVTSRVRGQEQDWHQFQPQLRSQMDSKLDRRELGPFRQQMEEQLKSLRGQLQEKALPAERDDAAGIRKQLLAGFHRVSCDRPLNVLAPGPERQGECRYPTVLRSYRGPRPLTPPRFQPQPSSTPWPPSTPRPPSTRMRLPAITPRLPAITRGLKKRLAMQLSDQDGADGNWQDEQLSVMGTAARPAPPQ